MQQLAAPGRPRGGRGEHLPRGPAGGAQSAASPGSSAASARGRRRAARRPPGRRTLRPASSKWPGAVGVAGGPSPSTSRRPVADRGELRGQRGAEGETGRRPPSGATSSPRIRDRGAGAARRPTRHQQRQRKRPWSIANGRAAGSSPTTRSRPNLTMTGAPGATVRRPAGFGADRDPVSASEAASGSNGVEEAPRSSSVSIAAPRPAPDEQRRLGQDGDVGEHGRRLMRRRRTFTGPSRVQATLPPSRDVRHEDRAAPRPDELNKGPSPPSRRHPDRAAPLEHEGPSRSRRRPA